MNGNALAALRHYLECLDSNAQKQFVESLSAEEAESLLYQWTLWARPKQLPPDGPWQVWLILAGRGFGKTRSGAEWVRSAVENLGYRRIALVGETAADVRDVMVEGESGLLACCPPTNRPKYEPSRRRLSWPNGAIATTFSADDPEQLRGPQFDAAWADEIAKWRYPAAWDNLLLALRLGHQPRVVATTTPRPRPWLIALLNQPATAVTRGRAAENAANLAPGFLDHLLARYGGTRLARQEIDGEFLLDQPGALWTRARLSHARQAMNASPPELQRIVVAVDPAVTVSARADETGIIVAGRDSAGRAHVIADLSARMSPDAWARRAIESYHKFAADRVIAEVNQGGDLVIEILRTIDPRVPVKTVRASRGKRVRAEPVAALYEQGRVFHYGDLAVLEDQMCQFTGLPVHLDGQDIGSPDRLDALVWALTELLLGPPPGDSREMMW